MRFSLILGVAAAMLSGGCYDDGSLSSIDPAIELAGDSSIEAFAAEGWTIQTVDSTSGPGAHNSLAFDAQSNPAIAYSDSEARLRFARWNGVSWVTETIFTTRTPGSLAGVVWSPSLVFNPSGQPTIAFSTQSVSGVNSVRFAEKSGSSWTVKIIHDSLPNLQKCSLIYDSSGRPAVAYHGHASPVRYAWRQGNSWKKENIDSSAPTGSPYVSMALDPSGRPTVAYAVDLDANIFDTDTLKLARKSGSTWTRETVESGAARFGRHCSLAFDPGTGHPAIVHGGLAYPNSAIRFVRWNGSAWIGENMVDPGTSEQVHDGSLAFDASGNPVAGCWGRLSDGQRTIVCARRIAGVWQIETLETGPNDFANLTLDVSTRVQGNITIAYRKDDSLKFARRDAP